MPLNVLKCAELHLNYLNTPKALYYRQKEKNLSTKPDRMEAHFWTHNLKLVKVKNVWGSLKENLKFGEK